MVSQQHRTNVIHTREGISMQDFVVRTVDSRDQASTGDRKIDVQNSFDGHYSHWSKDSFSKFSTLPTFINLV